MNWRGIEVGPALSRSAAGEVLVGLDRGSGLAMALRWFPSPAWSPDLPALPWPPEPSPNLSRTLRIERSGQGLAVASELALGPTLELLIATPQPPSVVAGLALQMLAGLEELHKHGRAHGRLHPGNLILDVDAGALRIVDLCAGAIEGVPRGADLRKLFVRPDAKPVPEPRDDLYAVGRIAEALLRGGLPRGNWSPLEQPPGAPAQFQDLCRWVARCQSLDQRQGYASASEAAAALRALGTPGDKAVAQVKTGRWVIARRTAQRAIARWKARPPPADGAVEDLSQAISSVRATSAWRRLGVVAVGAVALSVAVAARPRLPGGGSGTAWPDDACVEGALPRSVAAAGDVSVEIVAPPRALVAIDGCPVGQTAAPLLVSAGRHQLRTRLDDRVTAEEVTWAPDLKARIEVEQLPLATANGTTGAQAAEADLRRLAETPPEQSPVDPSHPWAMALLDPLAGAALAVDAREVAASTSVRAAVPDDLGLSLDALRSAKLRFDARAESSTALLEKRAAEVLAVRQPGAGRPLLEAAVGLAALRLAQSHAAAALEAPLLAALHVDQSPMLSATVDDIAKDAELQREVPLLVPLATALGELAERCAVEAEALPSEPEPSAGSAP